MGDLVRAETRQKPQALIDDAAAQPARGNRSYRPQFTASSNNSSSNSFEIR